MFVSYCLSGKLTVVIIFTEILFSANLKELCSNQQLRAQVELAIFHFPNMVTAAHKRRGTPPHCIFAIDNLVRKAVNGLLSVVSPGELESFSQLVCTLSLASCRDYSCTVYVH